MTDYPIISQKSLSKAPRGGLRHLGMRSRADSELPLPSPHEAVVYKSGGSYVVDDGRSRTSDDHVVNATNISVVDMRENAPVTVQVSISSASAGEFAVQVTFLCTVRKPEEVVEAGLKDLADPLTQYVMRHQPLLHAGESREFDEINIVRRDVTAEIRAYVEGRPPRFRGVDVKLGSVQVLTPEELSDFHAKRREREWEGRLTSEEQRLEHDLAKEREKLEEIRRRQTEEYELERHRTVQEMARMRKEFEQQIAERDLAHEQLLRSARFGHAIHEAERLTEAIGADAAEKPLVVTASMGEMDMVEMTERLNTDRQRKRDEKSADLLREQTWKREDEHYDREIARENARLQYNLTVEELKAQAQVVMAGVQRGLADHQTIDKLMGVISGMAKQLEDASAAAPPAGRLPAGKQAAGEPEQGEPVEAELEDEPRTPRAASAPGGAADTVIDAEVVPDPHEDGDSAHSEMREEDLGI